MSDRAAAESIVKEFHGLTLYDSVSIALLTLMNEKGSLEKCANVLVQYLIDTLGSLCIIEMEKVLDQGLGLLECLCW